MKKKKINDGLRNLPKNFVTENELEENIKLLNSMNDKIKDLGESL